MNGKVYLLQCLLLCLGFFAVVFGLNVMNPVSFVSDYPPEIQAEYYRSQKKEESKQKLTVLMLVKKVVFMVILVFLFAWMAHRAGAITFGQGMCYTYGYIFVVFAFDIFFIDWVVFPNVKRMRLPGTEHMDSEYHQKWFHVKACFPMIPVFLIAGIVVAGIMRILW